VREIRLRDTLSGADRPLEPRDGRVGIYACGPTVYAPIHVGNARPFVVFALLKRFLEHEGHRVTLVENVTDVNDKIYDAAREAGVPSEQLAREMTERYQRDTDALGLGRPDHEPKASETIEAIVELIQALIDEGHAYAAGGDVYFRVRTFPEYGKLSNRRLEDMDQGEGDDAATELKESPQDFALWKARKPEEDTSWPAPWGEGRPGWHIECSAMAEQILGLDFDVHGGGLDLVFPHHENEIAQTEAARRKPLARIWMHNGMVQFEQEKMSKSVGNIRSLDVALDEYGRDALVMYFVSGHYRSPLAFSPEVLDDARRSVERIRDLARRLDPEAGAPGIEPYAERFWDALADDFNSPIALAALFDWVREANRRIDAGEAVGPGPLREMLWTFGLDNLLEPEEEEADAEARRLLKEREAARAERDFELADRKRDELAERGWEVRDTAEGPQLVRRA
jgi:cysteinyl-tRNA synthetase